MNFEKTPAWGRACGWIRNILESARLRFHGRPRNREKCALQAAGNFTNDYLLCLEYRVPNIYFNVENELRATQTRVTFNPAARKYFIFNANTIMCAYLHNNFPRFLYDQSRLDPIQYTVLSCWSRCLTFSTYTTPPPLWERFSSYFRFVQFSHGNVQIWNIREFFFKWMTSSICTKFAHFWVFLVRKCMVQKFLISYRFDFLDCFFFRDFLMIPYELFHSFFSDLNGQKWICIVTITKW